MVLTNDVFPSEMMPKARAAAEKAVALDPDLAEGWTMLAFGDFWYDWDWRSAEEHFKRALELDPNGARTHAFYAHFLSNMGRHDEAIEEIRRARQADPLDLLIGTLEGQIQTFAGNDDAAIKVLQSTVSVDPNFWLAYLFIARDYIKKGMWDEAIAAAAKAREITKGNAEAVAVEAYALTKAGRRAEAKEKLDALEARSRSGFVPSYVMAEVALALGDKGRAFELLERAFDQREPLMVFLNVEPRWDEIRNEPRFVKLIRKMNFAQGGGEASVKQ
jgi:tetratricopeptide (TPR) repeat protein